RQAAKHPRSRNRVPLRFARAPRAIPRTRRPLPGLSMRATARSAVGAHAVLLLEARDDFIQALLLDFRREIGAKALHVGDALYHDVPRLPALIGFSQTEIDRHLFAVIFF